MDTRKAGKRHAAKAQVISEIENHLYVGYDWHRDLWVEWLKSKGMISKRTNACDCRTVSATIQRLKAASKKGDTPIMDKVAYPLMSTREHVILEQGRRMERALHQAWDVMNHLGDTLNSMDAADEDAVEWARPKFALVREALGLSNVRGEVSLLAFGTKACSAGDVPKVPQGQGLAPPPR